MRVLLYSKAECRLCDAFHFELIDLQSELGFAYEKRQLQGGDPFLLEWGDRLPLVEIETGEEAAPIRLAMPISQRQLRTQVRQLAAPQVR